MLFINKIASLDRAKKTSQVKVPFFRAQTFAAARQRTVEQVWTILWHGDTIECYVTSPVAVQLGRHGES